MFNKRFIYRCFLYTMGAIAAFIMKWYHRPGEAIPSDEKAEKNGPVTKADLAISAVLWRLAKLCFPGAPIADEERGYEPYDGFDELVISDPLDGTDNFAKGGNHATHATAIVYDGEVEAAIIKAPLLQEPKTCYAERGRGVTVNGRPVRVSTRTENEGLRIVMGTVPGGHPRQIFEDEELVLKLRAVGHTVLPMYSSMYNCMLLAEGKVDIVIFAFRTSHDGIGWLAVKEAGGTVSDLYGGNLDISAKEIRGYVMANCSQNHMMAIKILAPHLP